MGAKVVEYESLPTICFVCGKYGHVSDSCHANDPAVKRDAPPPPNAAQSHGPYIDAFGPWIIAEKRQRRPARNLQPNDARCSDKQPGGSRFNPISEDAEDAIGIVHGVDPIHDGDPVTETGSHSHKGKAVSVTKKPRTVHVTKPLTVTLNDFPIVPKFAATASSSRSAQLRYNVTKLDKSRHSSVVISENSDPNLQDPIMAPHVTPACNNSLTLGKPPDTRASLIAGSDATNMCEKQPALMLNADSLVEAQAIAMLE
ncbi:hypothetical protein V6N13_082409 [Hibiscus sabdariffa]